MSDLKQRFETVAMPHLDAVYRVARALARDPSEAEDLVQEAFVRAFRAFEKFELREYGAKPWLLRILHNVFYTNAARDRRRPTLLDDVDFDHFGDELNNGGEPLSAESFDWEKVEDELKNAVDELAPEYRTVLMLWAVEGLTYKEIAMACDCAIGTVMSRLYRARQILGRELREFAQARRLNTERFES